MPWEGELLEFPKQDQLFATELRCTVLTNKTLHSSCWQGRKGLQNFWLSSAAGSRSPGNHPFSVTCSPSWKGNRKGSCTIPPLLSNPQALVRLTLIFNMTFPSVVLQICSTGHRWVAPHRRVFSSCTLCRLQGSVSSKQSSSLSYRS